MYVETEFLISLDRKSLANSAERKFQGLYLLKNCLVYWRKS